MSSIVKKIVFIVLGIALLIYTLVRYSTGQSDLSYVVIAVALIGYIVISMVSSLIRELKNR